jgi:predicted S18 family serine protease
LVLVPAGQRQSVDMATKQSVDVIERGRRQGVDVREVSDVYEAYELLTGQALPKPVGMKEVRPALPGQV